MAHIGTATIKVVPDLSAFSDSVNAELLTELLADHLLQYLPRNKGRADLRVVAAALLNRFAVFPKDFGEETA